MPDLKNVPNGLMFLMAVKYIVVYKGMHDESERKHGEILKKQKNSEFLIYFVLCRRSPACETKLNDTNCSLTLHPYLA